MSATVSIFESSKTIKGEWPLNSIVTLWTLSAAFFKISFPTLVEPVIETFLTISDSISCSETDAGSPLSLAAVRTGLRLSFNCKAGHCESCIKYLDGKKVLSKNTKGQKIIKYLFAYICKNPKKFIKNQKINKDKFRSVSDFISGMTDRYAINLYNNLKWTFSTFILTKLKI